MPSYASPQVVLVPRHRRRTRRDLFDRNKPNASCTTFFERTRQFIGNEHPARNFASILFVPNMNAAMSVASYPDI